MMDFAGARTGYEDADYVIVGVPFDGTSSFRPGSAEAPEEIRRASYCFEPFMMEYGVSLSDIKIHDMGDISIHDTVENMGRELQDVVDDILDSKKFPIIIGGEHSLSSYVVSCFEDVFVLILDAHLDYRDTYEGLKRSHATVTRRISESSIDGLTVLGVRSISQDEWGERLPTYYGPNDITEDIINNLSNKRIYLSIDMDVFDPSFAPGVGNPEPYGMEPILCKRLIDVIADNLVGVDIVETCPKYDTSGITSNLAARFIYDILGARHRV